MLLTWQHSNTVRPKNCPIKWSCTLLGYPLLVDHMFSYSKGNWITPFLNIAVILVTSHVYKYIYFHLSLLRGLGWEYMPMWLLFYACLRQTHPPSFSASTYGLSDSIICKVFPQTDFHEAHILKHSRNKIGSLFWLYHLAFVLLSL